MKARKLGRRIAAVLLLALVGCRGEAGDVPHDLAYGRTVCAACGRRVDDPRFAAQYRLPDGTVKAFDDPVCLFRSLRSESSEPRLVYFHDHDADAWIPARQVWLARTPDATSHGHEWAAYATFAAAQDAVTSAGAGEILPFEKAKQRLGIEPTATAPSRP